LELKKLAAWETNVPLHRHQHNNFFKLIQKKQVWHGNSAMRNSSKGQKLARKSAAKTWFGGIKWHETC
jgi:hypothetical protein